MKHGVAFRKFSRTSSHRMLMLRNLVTSLFEHEQIRTTLPKARDTARLAEKIITLGKKGDGSALSRAEAFLLKPSLLPKVFGTFAQRYARRPGGYTRIHKFGNRIGDNAPQAVLELVDNPRDLRWEITSRAVGWDLLKERLKSQTPAAILNAPDRGTLKAVQASTQESTRTPLRPKTQWNVQKLLKFRGNSAASELSQKADKHMTELLATPMAMRALHQEKKEKSMHAPPPRARAGQVLPGDTRAALDVSYGQLGHSRKTPTKPISNMQQSFGRKYAQVP